MAFVTLLLHLVVSCSIVLSRCKGDPPETLVPSVQQWLLYVALWPVLAVLVSEGTKRRDRRYHMHLQKTLRVLFNTRLGHGSGSKTSKLFISAE
ncbi:TMCO4 [Symbiodinium microadriaticum]|nr:TMCO4 [Symbiodinium microadriaticum]